MIRSFRDRDTLRVFQGQFVPAFQGFQRQAELRLNMLEEAESLRDLAYRPGNRLESLSGDRAGLYSIRINSQWRICFRWSHDGAHEVEIVDYH